MNHLLDLLIGLSKRPFFIPFYHAVSETAAPHYKNLYSPRGIGEFERDLDCFLRHYEPLSLDDFARVKNNPGKGRYCLITFDDGLSEVYEHAFPVLQRKKVPAVVFLNPAFVHNRGLFYRYKVSILIEEMRARSFEENSDWIEETGRDFETAKRFLLSLGYDQTGKIDHIAQLMGVNFANYLKIEQPYLTMSRIREMKSAGIQFGGHSMDHPVFSKLSFEDQLRQANESMDWVCANVGESIRTFAFPFSDDGVKSAYFDQINAACTFGTAKIKVDDAKNHFQRLSMEVGQKSALYILLREYALYQVKRLSGRHRVRR